MSILHLKRACGCDICGMAMLLSHLLSVFPTVVSVTCGGLSLDGATSVVAKHLKSILAQSIANICCTMLYSKKTVSTELLRSYITKTNKTNKKIKFRHSVTVCQSVPGSILARDQKEKQTKSE